MSYTVSRVIAPGTNDDSAGRRRSIHGHVRSIR